MSRGTHRSRCTERAHSAVRLFRISRRRLLLITTVSFAVLVAGTTAVMTGSARLASVRIGAARHGFPGGAGSGDIWSGISSGSSVSAGTRAVWPGIPRGSAPAARGSAPAAGGSASAADRAGVVRDVRP